MCHLKICCFSTIANISSHCQWSHHCHTRLWTKREFRCLPFTPFSEFTKETHLRCTREIHMDRHPPIFPDLSRGFDICFSAMSFEGCRPRWRVTRRAVKHPWGKECANIYIRPPLHKVGTEMLDIHLCIIGMYKTRSKIQVSVQVTEWLAHRYLTNVAKVRFPAGDLIPAP